MPKDPEWAEHWASNLCTLLDNLEMALRDEDYDTALELVMSRFDVAEKHGLTVEPAASQDVH